MMYGQGRSVVFDGVAFVGETAGGLDENPLPMPSGWTLSTVAGTNPSRPVFTPPQMIQDLIELPRLLKETGDFLRNPSKVNSFKKLANIHLGARFGWGPLIEDLGKLLGIQSLILKRTKELNQLYSGKGLRRRLRFGDSTETSETKDTFTGAFSQIANVKVSITVKKAVWSTIRWKPLSPPPYNQGDESQNRFVKRLIFGATPEGMAKGLWDVIPWTWLIGWFTNIGKYTLAFSNTVPAGYGDACLMRSVLTTRTPGQVTYSGGAKGNLSVSGTTTKSWKMRTVAPASITPGFSMPFLDMSKLSILGSLAAQRFSR